MEELKLCPRCQKTHPLTDFYKNKRSHTGDGRSYYCKFCDRALHKQNYDDRKNGAGYRRRGRYTGKKQLSLFNAARPESGPKCTCGKVLYHYELHLGRCMPCQTKRIRTGAYVLAQLAAGD